MAQRFFIAGAPRCGTTALARWLGAHPSIYMSVPKEPHFFSDDLQHRVVRTQRAYERLFRGVRCHHQAIGEASTWYLFSETAVPNIERAYPGAKYVVMSRDPVAMAQSLHLHNLRHLHESAATLEQAWGLQGRRARGFDVPKLCREPMYLQYRAACSLGHLIRRLVSRAGTERVLHVRLEQLSRDPQAQYQRALAFLDVADDGRTEFPKVNESTVPRSKALQRVLLAGGRVRNALGIRKGFGFTRLNERGVQKQRLDEGFAEALRREFQGDVELLNELDGTLAR